MIKIDGIKIETNNFPDGTLLVKYIPKHSSYNTDITWLYENDAELFTLQCLVDKIKSVDVDTKIYLTLGYIPHARMDRVKNPEDVFTLKTFCNIINSMNFTGVIVSDPHSDVSKALLNKVIEGPTILGAIKNKPVYENMVHFYPDAGAQKRYGANDANSTFGIKTRSWETGKIENLIIADPEVVKDKDVLIIDDICSYGGTFVKAAKALREAGAAVVDLAVTHCEDNIFKGDVFNYIDEVYTTNSILHEDKVPGRLRNRVTVFDFF